MSMDYYTTIKRSMFKMHKEIGAMPFLLFEYYLTWQTAPDGIRPSLQTIANDLGLETNAICNLRKRLASAGWIKYENGEVFILKTFTPCESPSNPFTRNEPDSQEMNQDSRGVNGTDVAIKGFIPEKEKENKKEEEDIYPPANDLGLVDNDFADHVENTFAWIREKKDLQKLHEPKAAWLQLFADLESEGINLNGFRDFYNWVENLSWVTGTISIKLLYRQIEAYKNRETIEAKNQIKRNGGNNGSNEKPNQPHSAKIRNRDYSKFDGLDPTKAFGT